MFLHHAVDCATIAKKATAIAFTITQFIHVHDIGYERKQPQAIKTMTCGYFICSVPVVPLGVQFVSL